MTTREILKEWARSNNMYNHCTEGKNLDDILRDLYGSEESDKAIEMFEKVVKAIKRPVHYDNFARYGA